MQKRKDRFIIREKKTENCGDPYCSGHSYNILIDTKTGNSIFLNGDLNVIIAMNFFAKCLEEEKHH